MSRHTTAEEAAAGEWAAPAGVVVAMLCGVFVAAAIGYWWMLPYGQGPDEESHGLFVATLAGAGPPETEWAWGLPVFPTSADNPNFETHQPPLYYLLAAVVFRGGGGEAVPFLSLAFGILLILVTWRMLREVLAADLALAAAAVVALLPMHAFLATRVNNDPLANLLWALALWRWVRTLRDGPSRREGLLAGLAVGAALLTKQNSIGLLPMAVLAALLSGCRSGRWREAGEQLAITLAVALGVAGWWYVRNQVLYGDPFAQRVFNERFLTTRATPETLRREFYASRRELHYWPYVWDWVLRTSVIYIGHAFDRLPSAIAPCQAWLLFAATAGAMWALIGRWRRTGLDEAVATCLLLAGGMAVIVAMLVRFNLTYFQGQGRYLFPMLPGWALLLTGGLSRPWPPRLWPLRRYGVVAAPLWLGLLNALLLYAYVPGLLERG